MAWRKKPKAREPHPDPATEQQLQRILSLRASAERDSGVVEGLQAEVLEVYADLRTLAHRSQRETTFGPDIAEREEMAAKRVGAIQNEIRRLEAAVDARHDEIGKRMAEMNVSDLAWL